MKKKYKIKLTTLSPLLVGGVSYDYVYDAKSAVKENKPYIPASVLKGTLRIEFERIVRTIYGEKEICDFTQDGAEKGEIAEGCGKCIACRLFGGGGNEGKLRFYDANTTEPIDFMYRAQSSISRKTGRSVPRKLFHRMFVPEGINFTGYISLKEDVPKEDVQIWEKFLEYLSSKKDISMGSSKSIGLGRVSFEYEIEKSEGHKKIELTQELEEWDFYEVSFRQLEPINLGYRKHRYIIPTLRFIPASTMRGAFAYALLNYGVEDKYIERWFLDGVQGKVIRFSNFYYKSVFPRWATLKRPKSHNDRYIDILIHNYLLNYKVREMGKIDDRLYNMVFGNDIEVYEAVPSDPEPSQITFYTKLTIDRKTMRAKEDRLYTIEVILPSESESVWNGLIYAPYEVLRNLKGRDLFVGARKSKGFGRMQLRGFDKYNLDNFEQSTIELTSKINELASKYEINLPENRIYFTLDFISDVVLNTGDSLKDYLKHVLGNNVKIESTFLSTDERGGFDYLRSKESNSPVFKEKLSFYKRGSVILLSVDESIWEDVVKDKLSKLLEEGIGHRVKEGFGMFMVSSTEHIKKIKEG